MLAIFKKKWVWITAIFLIINIAGLVKITSLLREKQGYEIASLTSFARNDNGIKPRRGFIASIEKRLRQFGWFTKKAAQDTVKKVVKDFEVDYIRPYMSDASASIYIRFTHEPDFDKIKGYIEVTPEVDFYAEDTYSGITLYGDFLPGRLYTVEVLKGMPSERGPILKETVKQTVAIPDYEPTYDFKVPGIYMSLEGNQTIPIEVVNVDKLEVKVHKVYANNIVYLLNNMDSYSFPSDLGLDVFEEEIDTKALRNEKKQFPIDLRSLLPDGSRGLFFMTVNKPDGYYWSRESKLILTTDIGIVAKKSNSDLFVWLNSLSMTSAVSGATIKVFTKTNQQILQGTTDENGLVHFKDIVWSGDRKPFVITASTEDDLSFIELEKCALSEADFDVQGRPYLSAGYEGFLYTDRGIYRPGERVHLRAILRGVGCETPESFPVIFEINRPDGRQFEKLNAVLSGFGTADVDVDIPDYALTGGYTANLKLPGSKETIGSYKFSVEEFMPDRIKVEIDVPDKRFNIAQVLPVKVIAEHFFGAPASERQIELSCSLKPIDFKPKGYSDYEFVDKTKEFSTRTIHIGVKKSDEQGEAEFELKLPKGILSPSALNCSISAVVRELGGRAVTSHLDRLIDAYPYYIGIRQSSEGYAAVGKELEFDYVVVSPEGEKIIVPELQVNVSKVIWSSVLKKDKNNNYRYVSESKEEPIFEDTISPEDGKRVFGTSTSLSTNGERSRTIGFAPKSWGDYIVRIKGKDKGMHTASLKFYCSGYGYMPWAMERPDRIELKLDKSIYNAGDVAKLLIKSPFKGKALITVSGDKVLFTEAIELAEPTQEIPIAIQESFRPNAYCAITVIRPIVPDEEWAAHRAYGIIPLMLDNSTHKLKISIGSPEKAGPKETVKLDIDVQSASGSIEPAELSVALVDEGILRLTGFKTPDAFDFFYGKKGNYIKTGDIYSLLIPEFEKKKVGADSTPSGDRVFDPKKHLIPISAERVKPIALWKSNIVTDNQGKASVEFKIPEFVGNLRVMVVAASNKDFGDAEKDIKIIEPLMIRPTIPRFLSAGDEFMLPVVVINTTGRDGNVEVSLETSEGFKILNGESFSIKVKNTAEGVVRFKLKAPSLPQKAEIKVMASMDGYSTTRTTELPVRPPAPFTTVCGSRAVKAPADETIGIPGGWLEGTEKFTLSIMPFPGLQFAGGLKFLMQYPYGCIEQTTSSVFPLLYLKDIAASVDPEKFSSLAVDNYIDAGIRRILSMQTYSGGFAFWPGYQKPYNWGSVYATDFLVEADKAGYAVPKTEKDLALNYLEWILPRKEEDGYSRELKAYSCFVLAKAGRMKASWIRRLQELKDELPAYSRFHLAAGLAALGDKQAVADILGQGFSDVAVKRQTGDSLDSYTRRNAVALSVYMDIDPENKMVPVLVKRLEAAMENGSWQTTQDNAMALLGLGKYARFIESQDVDYSGSISVGKELIAEFDDEAGARVKDIALGGKVIDLTIKGEGTAYYYWSAEGVPVSGKLEERDKGIRVRRHLFTRDGQPLDVNNIKQGEIIVVDISIQADSIYKNLIVADLLPACFEIENPRISTRETVEWIKKDIFEPDHIDIRDDRLLMFTDLPKTGNLHYRYIVRAVTKGEFALPPVSATCMYDPSIVSVHGQGKIEVK